MESDFCFGLFSLCDRCFVKLNQNCAKQSEINTRIYIFVSACAGAGGGSGGVPFEVWCRFYYPNVRDQVIAKVGKLVIFVSELKKTKFDLY